MHFHSPRSTAVSVAIISVSNAPVFQQPRNSSSRLPAYSPSIFFSLYLLHDQNTLSVTLAVSGLVAGEIFSSLFCAQMFFHTHRRHPVHTSIQTVHRCLSYVGELFRLSVPLTANRILLNLLQSIEAISIPKALITYGSSRSEALSLYGVLTGMALPCILFPSALTNSISVMLLPTVAELQASQKRETLLLLIKKVFSVVLHLVCHVPLDFCCLVVSLEAPYFTVPLQAV